MKKWWTKYKERIAHRQKIADANLQRFAEAVKQIRLENWERREAKRLAKATAKEQCRTPRTLVLLVSLFLPDSYALVILGDLAETYPNLRVKLGKLKAYIYVHRQALSSIWPIVCQCVRAGDATYLEGLAWLLIGFFAGLFIIFISYVISGEAFAPLDLRFRLEIY